MSHKKLKAANDSGANAPIAKAAGYELSAKELQSTQAEIPEEELLSVAGGTAYEMDIFGRVDLSKHPGRRSIFD